MEVSFEIDKIIKCAIYNTVFSLQVEVLVTCLVVVNKINYKGFPFYVRFIQCQTSTDISRIVNEFVQYV